MQLIDTPTGRYCIADGRDLGAFLKALKTASKPKRPRVSTTRPVRRFPAFYAGETSTADYVAEYYRLNRDLVGDHCDAARPTMCAAYSASCLPRRRLIRPTKATKAPIWWPYASRSYCARYTGRARRDSSTII
jgi:hypothetical protein